MCPGRLIRDYANKVSNVASDATHVYRGYRLQALFALSEILKLSMDAGLTYQPEGNEDFSVFDSVGTLVELNQVKAYTRSLSLADFKPEKRNSFFYRAAKSFKLFPDVKICIVSYGPVGPQLKKAIENEGNERDQIARKLAKFRFISIAHASDLLSRLYIRTVDEQTIIREVYSQLSASLTGIDPNTAFELLHYWLYSCSENKKKITSKDLMNRVHEVGKFLSERAAHIKEWGTTIVPIDDRDIDYKTEQGLKEEFYLGMSARYEHILADLDVIRNDRLQEIAEGFSRADIVILHGASGQGKTTLAYRYLREFFPNHWRFQVKLVESRQHALSLATALVGHADAMGMPPVAVYLDVSASDKDWPDFVRELSAHRNIRVLVTVREEDLQRATFTGATVRFAQVGLSFNETEARQVYESLVKKRALPDILNFEDAWQKFGSHGPLMEFVYLITQGDTLRERLAQQVARLEGDVANGRLRPEELKLLLLVAVASAYEAHLKLKPLTDSLQLPVPQRTLRYFEKEYLLRTSEDMSLATGLHPIRSAILADLLSDPTFAPWAESAQACLPLIHEPDIEIFLLYAFSRRPEDTESLYQSLASYQPERWTAIAGITRALIWLGIREYVACNHRLIEDAFKDSGNGWWLVFDFDLADAIEGSAFPLWDTIGTMVSEERKQELRSLQSRQTDKRSVFARAQSWLARCAQKPLLPKTDAEWASFGETLFWVGRFCLSWPLDDWLSDFSLEEAVDILPIEVLANVVFGVAHGYPAYFTEWMPEGRLKIIQRFRQSTRTVAIEDDGQKVTAHFIVELEPSYSSQSFIDKRIAAAKDRFHEETIVRLELLSKLLPDRISFAAQGYGLWQGETFHDATRKTGIDRSHLSSGWLTSVNRTFRYLAAREFRPRTWPEFSNQIWSLRNDIITCFEQLKKGLQQYFRNRKLVGLVNESIDSDLRIHCVNRLNRSPFIPACAVDEWGLAGESGSEASSEELPGRKSLVDRKGVAVQAYSPFLDMFRDFANHLSNFLNQLPNVMVLNSVLGRSGKEPATRAAVKAAAEQLEISKMGRLSTLYLTETVKSLHRMQREYRNLLGQYVVEPELAALEHLELSLYRTVWELWCAFESQPQRVVETTRVLTEHGTEILNRIRRRLRKEILRLTGGGVKISIASEKLRWDEAPALWLTIDGNNAVASYEVLGELIAALRTSVDVVPDTEFRQHVLDLHWQNVVIVPLVKGESLLGSALRFQIVSLLVRDELERWQFWHHPLSSEAMAALNIKICEHPGLEPAQRYISNMSNLSFYAAHIADFSKLSELDEEGLSQIREYLGNAEARISEVLQASLDAVKDMADIFNRLGPQETAKRPHLVCAMQALGGIHSHLLPTDGFDDQVQMNLAEVAEWAERLAKARESAGMVYLHWASDIFDNMNVE